VVHAARGPSPLTVRLIVGHGAGVSGKPRPGRPDAAGTRGRLLDGWLPTGCLETRGDPGQAEGCQPGIIQRARLRQAVRAPGTSRRSPPVRSRSPGRSKVRLPSMSAPRHAVTLSDTGRHGERAHCRLIETLGRRYEPGRDGSELGRSAKRSRRAGSSSACRPAGLGFRTTCRPAGTSPWRGSKEA
jgi:hypothetical protein